MLLRKFYPILALIFVLLVASFACASGDNTGTKVGEVSGESMSDESASGDQQPTPVPTQETFKLGDIVQVKGFTMALTDLTYSSNNILQATFAFENQSDEDVNVSSMLSFEARTADGTKLEQEIFDCASSLDGSILPGDRLKGSVCYKGAPETGITKIYFQDNIFASGATVFSVDMDELIAAGGSMSVDVPIASGEEAAGTSVETFNIGDVVQLEDHTIVLNSAEITNNILKANFTVQNQGTDEIIISSMLSFSAKAPDGTKLEQEIFDCPSPIDGSVLAGDLLRGDVCYSVPADAEYVNIYYEANILASGAVVWQVQR